MKNPIGTLIFLCGKMGAGKSTLSQGLAAEHNAVLLSEDTWLAALYPQHITSFDDYLHYSRQIKPLVKQLVQDILSTGTHVVMDFPANTISQRRWFVALCQEIGATHELRFLDVSDEQCLAQIAQRRLEQPERANFDTETVFRQVTEYFEPPSAKENINIIDTF